MGNKECCKTKTGNTHTFPNSWQIFLKDSTGHYMPLAVSFDKSQCFTRNAILDSLQYLDKFYEFVMGLFSSSRRSRLGDVNSGDI